MLKSIIDVIKDLNQPWAALLGIALIILGLIGYAWLIWDKVYPY